MVVLLAIDPSTHTAGWAVFLNEGPGGPAEGGSPTSSSTAPSRDVPTSGQDSPAHRTASCPAHSQWQLVETGVIVAYDRSHRPDIKHRIKAIEGELDKTAFRWQPNEVAYGKPPQLQLPHQQEGMELLKQSLEQWARHHNLPIHCYSVREIRCALVGRANGAKQELVYAVMTRWGLLGEGKTTPEWNAIAVGDYHLGREEVTKRLEV